MPGGVVRELSPKALQAIEKVVAGFDRGSLRSIVSEYDILANQWSPTAPRTVRKQLDGIVERAVHLRRDLALLSEEGRTALWDNLEPNGFEKLARLETLLSVLVNGAKISHNQIEPKAGRGPGPRRALIRQLVGIIALAGHDADATEKGCLVFVTRTVLADLGEDVKDVRSLVRDALGEIGRAA